MAVTERLDKCTQRRKTEHIEGKESKGKTKIKIHNFKN